MGTKVPRTLGGVGMRTETEAVAMCPVNEKPLGCSGLLLVQHNYSYAVTKDSMN